MYAVIESTTCLMFSCSGTNKHYVCYIFMPWAKTHRVCCAFVFGDNKTLRLLCFCVRGQKKHYVYCACVLGDKKTLRSLCVCAPGQQKHYVYCVFVLQDKKSITFTVLFVLQDKTRTRWFSGSGSPSSD